jgi:hypothetical protein
MGLILLAGLLNTGSTNTTTIQEEAFTGKASTGLLVTGAFTQCFPLA